MLTLFRLPKSYRRRVSSSSDEARETYSQDEVLHCYFNLDPFIVRERRPDKMRLSDRILVRGQDNLGFLVVDMQSTKKKDKAREGSIA